MRLQRVRVTSLTQDAVHVFYSPGRFWQSHQPVQADAHASTIDKLITALRLKDYKPASDLPSASQQACPSVMANL